ncbi:plasmalemma vesicle-associated protein [Nannospalax galili]|uniref:plasmalemma vesicle-associated protein n=1 Tax=Nannospalax galili TaxID=1026970 RepID=UPI000819DCA3|nr:plasmalemma vesicle-associated protein [Nannospalax galili]
MTSALKEQYLVAIIISEQRCQEQLKETNKTCEALLFKLGEKAKTLEMEVIKEKAVCAKDKEGLLTGKRLAEEQLVACGKAQEHYRQEKQVAEEQLSKVQALCLQLDKDKFEMDARNLWRDSIIPRALDALAYSYHPLGTDVASLRRTCDHMPSLMTSKVEDLARSLRSGIERVAQENADLKRQKFEAQQGLSTCQVAREKAAKEASDSQTSLQAQCQKQTQLALEEKAALRKDRDGLAQELDSKKRQVEQLKIEVEARISALDTCVKAKSPPPVVLPKPLVPGPQTPSFDPAGLEEFKKKILESYRSTLVNPAVPPSG